jgi:hypothetical protein
MFGYIHVKASRTINLSSKIMFWVLNSSFKLESILELKSIKYIKINSTPLESIFLHLKVEPNIHISYFLEKWVEHPNMSKSILHILINFGCSKSGTEGLCLAILLC